MLVSAGIHNFAVISLLAERTEGWKPSQVLRSRQYSTVQYGTVRYDKVQYGTEQRGAKQHSTVQYYTGTNIGFYKGGMDFLLGIGAGRTKIFVSTKYITPNLRNIVPFLHLLVATDNFYTPYIFGAQ